MNISIYSFFSGAGLLDLGFEDEGYNIVFVNEYDDKFLRAYKYARDLMGYVEPAHGYYNGNIEDLFKSSLNEELTKNIESDKKKSIVGFIGGPPCPDFSIAGKNEGVKGKNGRLTKVYRRMIIRHQPDFFVFENVKGLWKTKKHREEYEKMKRSFSSKGYVLTDKLVNALEYGVPQDRERIILVGIKSKNIANNKRKASSILKEKFHWESPLDYEINFVKNRKWPMVNDFFEENKTDKPEGIIEELTVEHWFRKNNVYTHPNANDYFKPKALTRFTTIKEGDVSKKSFKRLHRWRYSPTAAYGNNEVHLHPYKCRRLSVSEVLAIQSLPEKYIILPTLSLSDKFKVIGNGVPYLVGKSIAHEISIFLRKNYITNEGVEV